MSEPDSVETKEAFPAPTPHSLALLEAFQRSAARVEKPAQDPQKTIILLAGSTSKGLAHAWSDIDALGMTQNTTLQNTDVYKYFDHIDEEYFNLVENDARFDGLKKYLRLSNIIHDRDEKIVKGIPLAVTNPKEDPFEIKARETQDKKRWSLERRRPLLAERALPRTTPVEDSIRGKTLPYFVDVEVDSTTYDAVENALLKCTPETMKQYQPAILTAMLIFSSVAGKNVFEVTDGNLDSYRNKLIGTLRNLHDNDPQHYQQLMSILRRGWQFYKQQTERKYPGFQTFLAKKADEGAQPISPFFSFTTFPDVSSLEEYFGTSRVQPKVDR